MSKRTIAEFEPLLAGEKTLLAGLSSGDFVEIGGTTVPDADAGEERQVRGEFLRYLLLGGCKELNRRGIHVHEKGVQLAGAFIVGILDMQNCQIDSSITLAFCRFKCAPDLHSCRAKNIVFSGSELPGIRADGLHAGAVLLRDAVIQGEVRLLGAKLDWGLDCHNAQLIAGETGIALYADGIKTGASVDLSSAVVQGCIRLLGAKLGESLSCNMATLTCRKDEIAMGADGLQVSTGVYFEGLVAQGEIRLPSARIGKVLACDDAKLTAGDTGIALNASGVKVAGTFYLRNNARISGGLDLSGAEFEEICDEESCWPESRLALNHCVYKAFGGSSPVTSIERIDWLSRQDHARWDEDFWPQPWEQCAKVLREMGHGDDARAVLIDKEKRQRVDRRKGYWFGWRWLQRFMDFLLWAMVAYGHKPLRAFIWLAAFWAIGIGVFYMAEQHDAIKPNDVRILRSAEWVACAPDYPRSNALNKNASQLRCFLDQPEAASYPRFNAWVYSADTLLPIVALEMQSFWIPAEKAKSAWGQWARYFLWLQIIAGWGLSLLAVAGFSGLIKSD